MEISQPHLFFPAKPLGCYGDGGAIFTDSENYYELLTSLRVHGKGKFKYDNVRVGMNSRLDTIQAGILLPKLKAFRENEVDKRNEFAKYYTEKLQNVVITPYILIECALVGHNIQFYLNQKRKECLHKIN